MAIGVRRIYGATALTGAASGALSDIDVGILKPNDMAIAKANDIPSPANPGHTDQFDGVYFYRFANVGTAEDVPKVIKPNNAGGSGRWLLISPQYFMENIEVEPDKKVIVNEIVGNGSGLSLGWQDGTVDIVVGTSAITVTKDITTDSQIISTLAIGTAPFSVTSTTQVDNLNAQYISGNAITNLSRLNNNTNKYSVLPQVTNAATIYPTVDADLVTKKYVDDELAAGSSIDHGTLTGLADDDHTQYVLASGTRAFSGVVSGVTPTLNAHLTTKGYVDGLVNPISTTYVKRDGSLSFTGIISGVTPTYGSAGATNLVTVNYVGVAVANIGHSSLLNLGADNHTQYILATGTRAFTGVVSGVTPTISAHLTTKGYVDTGLTSITNVYVVRDGTIAFTGPPQVTNTLGIPDFGPTQPYHLATQAYVDSVVTGGSITHSSLSGLTSPADDHTQYILASGTRAFTGVVSGVTPTLSGHLATKGYVDGVVVTSHTSLTNLTADDHTLYIRVDGLRVFDTTTYFPGVSNNGSVPDDVPTQPWDLATKEYVDDGVATLGSLELFDYVDIYGRHAMLNTQSYVPRYEQIPFKLTGNTELVPREYVDYYASTMVISENDGHFDYLDSKLEFSDAFATTNFDLGVNTGIRVDKTTESVGSVTWAEVVSGGSGFFVYDFDNVGYPQTYPAAAGTLFNSAGSNVGGTLSISETFIQPISVGTEVDIRVFQVIGDVGYMEIVDGGTGLVGGDGDYPFTVAGDGYQDASWIATVASGTITAVQRDAGAAFAGVGAGYSATSDVVSIPGITGSFTLRPYIVGAITRFEVVALGTGYTSATYTITGIAFTNGVDFNVSGLGTSSGTNVGSLNVIFHNPINEKLKLSQYLPTITTVGTIPDYATGYTRTTGQVINTLTFDEYGHVTGITEAGTGGASWILVDETDTGLVLTADTNYFALTDTSAFELRMPATPVLGTTVIIDDYGKNSSVFNITVNTSAGANLLVEGSSATPLIIDVNGARVIMTFVGGTYGWRYKVI